MEGVLVAFERAKIPVMITELDMSVLPRPENYTGADIARASANSAEYDPYHNGLPEAKQQELADHYKSLFELYRKHASNIKRINFWGVTDSDTWLDNWPIPGRRDYPLLFDRDHKPKPAYFAVIEALSKPINPASP
jgi:endo-1,4-beta-xylanase